MPGNEGHQIRCACQFVPVSLSALGPAGFSLLMKHFVTAMCGEEDVSYFLVQTPAVLRAVLRPGARDEESMARWHSGVFSSMCLWTD